MLRQARRVILYIVLLLALTGKIGQTQVTLYRDTYGTPSVAADTLADALYGLGYAMAQDIAESMARNYKQARGRLAEVDGQSQLLVDSFLRSLGIEELAEKKAATLNGEQKLLVERFCAGANKALAEGKSHLPSWIEPFTPTDVLALAQLLNCAFPLQSISNQLLPGTGSNQFVVGPKRSATGHAILSADPHLTWSGPMLWYEYSLYCKEFNFHGVTLSGLPFGSMGHTDKVAWCMTNNDPDLYDFFTVTTDSQHPNQYNYHGEWRDFEKVALTLKYREGGELKTREQTIRRTAWGPMIPFRSQAVALAPLGDWEGIEQSLLMVRARNAGEFREALKKRGLSMWNIAYADIKGNIGYQYNAHVPRRDSSFDWTKPVPGDDPHTRWGDPWTLDELPHVENPKSNLLVNANSSPWLTPQDDEIKATGWPRYITTYGPTTRYERLSTLLSGDTHVSLENAKRYATDTQVPYALPAIAALKRVVRLWGDPGEEPPAAMELLQKWNGRADIDAKGCAIYFYWLLANKAMTGLAQKAARGEAWNDEESQAAEDAFKAAVDRVKQTYGRLDVTWGEIHLSKRGAVIAPVSGLGYFQPGDATACVVPNYGPLRDGKIVCTGGSSFRMIVHLDPKGIHSWSVLPYGDSQDPTNPHYADQMRLFGRGEYKDTLFGLKRIQKEAASKSILRVE